MRAVIDTNVLFEGLTRKKGACADIIAAWQYNLFDSCVSNSLVLEYDDILTRKLSIGRWLLVEPVYNSLLLQADHIRINFSCRPLSPDPSDDFVIDCAYNANAVIVTYNLKDLKIAERTLRIPVLKPEEFAHYLLRE